MKLINIGFGNLVSAERVLAIVSPDSAPIKRLIQESRERGMLIDATYGRKTASVFVMDSDHVVLSAIAAEKLALSKPTMPGKPKAILAHTVKGKGVSFMENQVGWHGKAPNAEQRDQALKELEG